MARLRIPSPQPVTRADGLWRHCCFEAFIRGAGKAGYREFNFSPSGAWALYAFRGYREPEPRAAESPAPAITVRQTDDRLELEAAVTIDAAGWPGSVLEIGLAAVIETQQGSLSYWALKHPSPRPDFHHPDSFALSLPLAAAKKAGQAGKLGK
jgi:hypothetical protein